MKALSIVGWFALSSCLATAAWSQEASAECRLTEETFYASNTEEVIFDCLDKTLKPSDSVYARRNILYAGIGHMEDLWFVDLLLLDLDEDKFQTLFFGQTYKTVLHVAVEKRAQPQIILRLAQWGAEVDAKYDIDGGHWLGSDKGTTPLHLAASQKDNADTIALLIALGADIDAENKYDVTPKGVATMRGTDEAKFIFATTGAKNRLISIGRHPA